MVETKFEIDDMSVYKRLCGFNDGNVKKIEEIFEVTIIPRGNVPYNKSFERKK